MRFHRDAASASTRVHATGLVGSGPTARRLLADVQVTPFSFPVGIFSETLSGNGNVGLHHESIFTNGCIKNRQDDSHPGSGFQFQWDAAAGHTVLDLFYDQPTAAHATARSRLATTPAVGRDPAEHQFIRIRVRQITTNPVTRRSSTIKTATAALSHQAMPVTASTRGWTGHSQGRPRYIPQRQGSPPWTYRATATARAG